MTGGFHTVIVFPHEGAMITEHKTKAEALKAHQANLKDVGSSDGNSYLLGAALIHIEVFDDKGEWRESLPEKRLNYEKRQTDHIP